MGTKQTPQNTNLRDLRHKQTDQTSSKDKVSEIWQKANRLKLRRKQAAWI
jgi:hypothetical protein